MRKDVCLKTRKAIERRAPRGHFGWPSSRYLMHDFRKLPNPDCNHCKTNKRVVMCFRYGGSWLCQKCGHSWGEPYYRDGGLVTYK